MPRAVLALALFLCSTVAHSCICAPPPGIPERAAENALFRSDVVAVMTIRAIREERPSPDAEPVLVAEFEPVELFKGEKKVQKTYRAKVLKTSHDRLLQAKTGMQWLIYLRGTEPLDFTHCSLSGPVDLKEGELAHLRHRAEH